MPKRRHTENEKSTYRESKKYLKAGIDKVFPLHQHIDHVTNCISVKMFCKKMFFVSLDFAQMKTKVRLYLIVMETRERDE
jgi:hypothetical protein